MGTDGFNWDICCLSFCHFHFPFTCMGAWEYYKLGGSVAGPSIEWNIILGSKVNVFLDKFQQYFQSEIFCCTFSKMSTFLQKSAIAFAKMKGAEGGGLAVWKKSKNHLVWNHQPDSCVKVVALIQGGFSFSWFCSKSVGVGKILSKKVKVQASHFLPVVPLLSIFWEVFCHLQHLLERTSKKNHPVSI